jgi:hypothetical protein
VRVERLSWRPFPLRPGASSTTFEARWP